MVKSILPLIAGSVAMLSTASAAQINGETLAKCMIDNSTPEIEQQFRDVMIAALKDELQSAQGGVMAMGMSMVNLAVENCGATLGDLQTPQFELAAERYGEYIGEKVITQAFAKIGL